jgi:hypothetical protein
MWKKCKDTSAPPFFSPFFSLRNYIKNHNIDPRTDLVSSVSFFPACRSGHPPQEQEDPGSNPARV